MTVNYTVIQCNILHYTVEYTATHCSVEKKQTRPNNVASMWIGHRPGTYCSNSTVENKYKCRIM